MGNIGFTIFGASFCAFLAVSAVAGIVADYKKRDLELQPLRSAIERGQQLDPAIIERLMAREQHNSDPQYIYFRIWGIVTVAAGAGLGLFSLLVSQNKPHALYPILGSGLLAVCVGIGLLLCANAIERHLSTQSKRESRA
jgi:hypothetical protein